MMQICDTVTYFFLPETTGVVRNSKDKTRVVLLLDVRIRLW